MPDLLLEDFPSRIDRAEELRQAAEVLIAAAEKWCDASGDSVAEKDASIALCWAVGLYRMARGDADYAGINTPSPAPLWT